MSAMISPPQQTHKHTLKRGELWSCDIWVKISVICEFSHQTVRYSALALIKRAMTGNMAVCVFFKIQPLTEL